MDDRKRRQILECLGGSSTRAESDRIASLFSGMNEQDRGQIADEVHEIAMRLETGLVSPEYSHDAIEKGCLAALACGSRKQLSAIHRRFGWRLWSNNASILVLADRRAEWMCDFLSSLIDRETTSDARLWAIARVLERLGHGKIERTDGYTLGMLVGIGDCRWQWQLLHEPEKLPQCPASAIENRDQYDIYTKYRRSALGGLRADPELLVEDVWQLFEVEGNSDISLTQDEQYFNHQWREAFLVLAQTGEIDRGTLLDAILDALARDFPQYRAGWYSRTHDALAPSIEERATRASRYLHLLGSKIPPTVSFALKNVKQLAKQGHLPPSDLVPALAPTVHAKSKGVVRDALRLIRTAVETDPSLREEACAAVVEALAQESTDLQRLSLSTLEQIGSPWDTGLKDRARTLVDSVAPSLRGSVLAWLGGGEEIARGRDEEEIDLDALRDRNQAVPSRWRQLAGLPKPAQLDSAEVLRNPLAFRGCDVPRLNPESRITPITEIDDLLESCGVAMESAVAPDFVERCLDGISRLCDRRREEERRKFVPLLKRVSSVLEREGYRDNPRYHLLIFYGWWNGHAPTLPAEHWRARSPIFAGSSIHVRAMLELGARVAAALPRPMLHAPTHGGMWIDPMVAVDRYSEWQSYGDAPPISEQVIALLRLAPENRDRALGAAANLTGESGSALRYALGGDEPVGRTAALWVAAARCRAPYSDDPAVESVHPGLGPDAGTAARYLISVERETFRDRWGKEWKTEWLQISVEPPLPALRDAKLDESETVDPDLPTVLAHRRMPTGVKGYPDLQQTPETLDPAIWPQALDSWLAIGAQRLAYNLREGYVSTDHRFIEALLDPDVPLDKFGELVLMLGLCAKPPEQSSAAVDIAIAAIADSRATASTIARPLSLLLPSNLLVPTRIARTFGTIARESSFHAWVIQGGLDQAFAAGATKDGRKLGPLMELHRELTVELGKSVDNPATRRFLSTLDKGKTGKAARALMQLEAKENDALADERMLRRVLIGRLQRAERWAAWDKIGAAGSCQG